VVSDDDAPPAIPHRAPSEIAKRIAAGHAQREHFPELDVGELAQLIQNALDRGLRKEYGGRVMYWDEEESLIVIVSPLDADGGSAFRSIRSYFDRWGERSR
jgi:hypothetical protein